MDGRSATQGDDMPLSPIFQIDTCNSEHEMKQSLKGTSESDHNTVVKYLKLHSL